MAAKFQGSPYYQATLYGLEAIEDSITQLLRQATYLEDEERLQLIDCCFFAARAHEGQKRRSGEPYVCHPIKVAEILASEVHFNLPVLEAAVLHDVIEDTDTDKSTVAEAFSDEVADLVDGVSKLEKEKNISPQELQARTFAKLVQAMQADPRVVMIKFADRMHNMQTLGALRPEKRRRIAQETLDVYVPIATRLGMYVFKTRLEELVFQQLYPWRYRTVKKLLEESEYRATLTKSIREHLVKHFESENINVLVRKRLRNLYEIYTKLEKLRFSRKTLDSASIPFVILTDSIEDCYRALGLIHQLYTPIAKKLSDYIALPKVNGYQSLHTSVLAENRQVISFQIRTKAMHSVAESGIISIWRYHNQAMSRDGFKGVSQDKYMRRWLKNIKSLSTLDTDPLEFYEAVKRDLTGSQIQVLTPKGEPIALPEGATVVDFAYYIHSDIANHLSSARVNGVDVPLDYQLSSGQTVELTSNSTATPQCAWLRHVKTGRARTTIRYYLRHLPSEQLEKQGYTELEAFLSRRGVSYPSLDRLLRKAAEQKQQSLEELLQSIALYEISWKGLLETLQSIAHHEGMVSGLRIEMNNHPGVLAAVADTIGLFKANILGIHFPNNMQSEKVTIQFKIHVESQRQIESIEAHIRELDSVNHVTYEETN